MMTVVSYLFWDIASTKYCRELNPTVKNIADIITRLGIATWYIVASVILYLLFRYIYKDIVNAMRALFVFLSLSLTGIFIDIL